MSGDARRCQAAGRGAVARPACRPASTRIMLCQQLRSGIQQFARCAGPSGRRNSKGGLDMARLALGLVMAGLVLAAAPAAAVICTVDAVPAATLLLPYFEVDLNNPNGLTTLFSVNNASATAILVHVVIWSDLPVPA